MGTVQVDGTNYTIMGTSLATVDSYLKAGVGAGPVAWAALVAAGNDDARGSALVAATRYLARKSWEGTPTVVDQDTAFPRDGVVDSNGDAVADGTTPKRMIQAEAELAALLVADSTINTSAGTGSNIQNLTAGPVSISYFRATIGFDAGELPMPPIIMDLVSIYLSRGVSMGALSVGFSECNESAFDECAQMTRRLPGG